MALNKIKTLTAACPECEVNVTFKSMPKLNQTVSCPSCGTNLEVAYLNPIMLDWVNEDAPQEYEGDYMNYIFDDAYDYYEDD